MGQWSKFSKFAVSFSTYEGCNNIGFLPIMRVKCVSTETLTSQNFRCQRETAQHDLPHDLRIYFQNWFSIFSECFRISSLADVNQWLESCTHTNFERSSSKCTGIENGWIDRFWSVDPLLWLDLERRPPLFKSIFSKNERHFLKRRFPGWK